MTGKNHEKSSHDKMEVIDHILSVYRENGKYETYREELEYLVLANAYFEREILRCNLRFCFSSFFTF